MGTDIPLPTFERNETTGSFEITGYSFRETGVVMEVTPHINNADEILVDLKPQVSSSDGSTSFSSGTSTTVGSSIPNFTVTTAQTQVLIKNGETIAVGGLMTDSTQVVEQKVPILGDIPIVGKVFRSKRQESGTSNAKVETLFFVTVTIVDTEGEPTISTIPVSSGPIGQKAAPAVSVASSQAEVPVERMPA